MLTRQKHLLVLTLLGVILAFSTGYTSVEVSGTISSDTTWTNSDTVIVTSSVSVTSAGSLTINAGTIILFQNGTGLAVDGTLQAIGTSADSIIFTSAADSSGSGAMGDWGGLDFTANSDFIAQCKLAYCGIRYAVDGIYVTGSNGDSALSVTNSEIAYCSDRCIEISNSDPIVSNCVIRNSENEGIYMTGASCDSVQILNCELYQEVPYRYTDEGIYVDNDVVVVISDCSIHDYDIGVHMI